VAIHDRDRVAALSRQLARAHQELRDRLDDVRAHPTLTEHCLAFCAALTAHHQGEDIGMFTELLREHPDLAGAVEKLMDDHRMIAAILTGDTDLDGLAAVMENHFRYEERVLRAALDQGVTGTGWAGAVFRFENSD
jgi:2-oxo-4-hydroxy-4-carboxy--5-ureidoimidazoline (OHCU) decarboxylase